MTKKLFVPSVKQVNNNTRAGNNGKDIKCPNCTAPAKVFHFSWSALTCQDCDNSVDKYSWKLAEVV